MKKKEESKEVSICNKLLDIIASDDLLIEQFADGLSIGTVDFEDFLETVQVNTVRVTRVE